MSLILVISPTPSHPHNAGNRARIFSLMSGLRDAGHQVGLVFVEMEDGDLGAMQATWDYFWAVPYRRPPLRRSKRWYDAIMKAIGSRAVAPYRIDDWFDASLSAVLEKIYEQLRPEIALVEYAYLSKALESFPASTLKLLDTHDILANRHRGLMAAGLPPMWFYTSVHEEKKALDRADCILAIQKLEQVAFAALTHRSVITVGHIAPLEPAREFKAIRGNLLLFVGSDNPLNVSALLWFVDEVFPLIRLRCPEACLEILGECARKIPDGDGLIRTGRVDDLKPYYRRAVVVVNPVQAGTGLKIKAIEALAMGCPMVTTSVGCAGLETGAPKAFCVADTAEKFAEAVLTILLSKELQAAMGHKALSFAQEYNRQALQPLLACLRQRNENEAGA